MSAVQLVLRTVHAIKWSQTNLIMESAVRQRNGIGDKKKLKCKCLFQLADVWETGLLLCPLPVDVNR